MTMPTHTGYHACIRRSKYFPSQSFKILGINLGKKKRNKYIFKRQLNAFESTSLGLEALDYITSWEPTKFNFDHWFRKCFSGFFKEKDKDSF